MCKVSKNTTTVNVTGLNKRTVEKCRKVAEKFGVTADAGVIRFVLEQWVAGKSISDLDALLQK